MSEAIQPGTLYVVSTPIGNLDDITLRAIHVLGNVDLVAAEDTRKTKFLLDHFSLSKPLVSYHSHNERRRVSELLQKLDAGMSVALVTDAGTPGISDPAYLVVRASIDRGIPVIPVPGPSAAVTALIVSGLPTDRFVFEGFLPVKKGRVKTFERLKSEERTIIIFESPFRIERTIGDIATHFGDRNIAVGRELTKKFEEIIRGRAGEVLVELRKKPRKGEFVIIIEGRAHDIDVGVG